VFVRYNLEVHTIEVMPVEQIKKFPTNVQSHIYTLLIGKIGEVDKNEINRDSDDASNASRLQIANPLRDWTDEDIRTFASSLYLADKPIV